MHRSSPGSNPHCAWTASRSCSWCRCPSPKFQPEGHPGHDLAVDPLVVLEAIDRLRDEQRQRAAVQVHEPEAHHLADQPHRGPAVVEARELVVDPRRAGRELAELAVRLALEEPHRVRPVARVVPHGEQERQARGEEVSEQRHGDEHHGEEGGHGHRAHAQHGHVGVRPEEREAAVDDGDVPFDGHAHGHVARDEAVQHEHEHDGMKRWHAQGRREERDGHADLEHRAGVGHPRGERRGAQVVRVGAVQTAAQPGEARERPVARHHADHRGKVVVELRDPGPEPEGELHRLGSRDPVAGEGEADDGDPVVLGARSQEDRLVGHAQQRHEHRDGQEVLERRHGREQHPHRGDEQRRVQGDVQPRARAPSQHGQARRERQLRGARAQEVEEAPDRREVAPGERSAAAAEAQHLEEQAPHDGLLERDGVQPPRADRAPAAQARAAPAERHPRRDVEPDLERVDGEHPRRRAVALHRPGLADHPTALGEGPLHPRERVVRRRRRIEQAHARQDTP